MLARTYRYLAGELPRGADAFTDDAGSVHEGSINGLAALGIVAGTGDGLYGPSSSLLRDQSATLVSRLLDALVEAGVADGRRRRAPEPVGRPRYDECPSPSRLSFRRMWLTMALDARTRSSIYGKFAELLGDHDANALMSEFPSVEADELVTKQFLRAELAVLRSELREEIGASASGLRGEIGELRFEMLERFHRQTVWLTGTVVASAGAIIAAIPLLS